MALEKSIIDLQYRYSYEYDPSGIELSKALGRYSEFCGDACPQIEDMLEYVSNFIRLYGAIGEVDGVGFLKRDGHELLPHQKASWSGITLLDKPLDL